MHTQRIFPALVAMALLVSPASIWSQAKPEAKKVEFLERWTKTSPRDAEAFLGLADWCRENSLEAEAMQCFTRAMAIDSDSERARTALGYKRHGTEWLRDGEKPAPFVRPGSARGKEPARNPEADPLKPTPAVPVTPVPASPPELTPATTPGGSPDVGDIPEATVAPVPTVLPPRPTAAKPQDAFAAELEAKKAWAKMAAEKLQTTFNVQEDADFLIHTTLPTSSRELRMLLVHLRGLKKTLTSILGVSGSGKIWPDKLHFILLKAETEYDRFANLVDGMASAKNPDGLYSVGSRVVLHQPESDGLARVLGKTALLRLNGSDRWVAWWIEEGVAEMLVSQSPAGQKKEHYSSNMLVAADTMKAEGDLLKIFNVIESPSFKDKDAPRNRALALSLVSYLTSKSKSDFQGFIRQIKSEAAPVPPPANDPKAKDAFNTFHVSYITFQEKALQSMFRFNNISSLQERWKLFVLQTGESLRALEASKAKADSKDDANKGKKNKNR